MNVIYLEDEVKDAIKSTEQGEESDVGRIISPKSDKKVDEVQDEVLFTQIKKTRLLA